MLLKEKKIKIVVLIVSFIILLINSAEANNLMLNGTREELIIEQGRTMISIDQVRERFNTRVDFNQISGEIRMQNPAVQIRGKVGSNIVFVNSRPQILQMPIKRIDNQVMIPLYFLHNIYGGRLSWNPNYNTVNYESNKLRTLSYKKDEEGLMINLKTDLAADYTIDYRKESEKLIIDLYQVSFIRFKQELLKDDFIDLIRVSKKGFDPAITRITIGLSDDLEYKVNQQTNMIKINLREKQHYKETEIKERNPIAKEKIPNYKEELIMIDPGHGGSDSGAIGFSGVQEKVVNMQLARKIKDKLSEKNFNVKMTRERDEFISLHDRAYFANQLKADYFISVHANYHSRQTVNGVETYAHYNARQDDWALAWYVQDGILRQTNATDHGLKAANFAVLRQTKMPAILLEAGFLSNPGEEAKLRTNSYQNKIAQGVVDGIVKFFATK